MSHRNIPWLTARAVGSIVGSILLCRAFTSALAATAGLINSEALRAAAHYLLNRSLFETDVFQLALEAIMCGFGAVICIRIIDRVCVVR